MNKKVLIIFVALASFLLGLNTVKATEGKDNLGSKTNICIYCYEKNKEDCVIIVLPKADAFDGDLYLEYRVFDTKIVEEDYATGSFWEAIGNVIGKDNNYVYRAYSRVYTNYSCPNYLNYAVDYIEAKIIGAVDNGTIREYTLTNNANFTPVSIGETFLSNGKIIRDDNFVLNYKYGIDSIDYNDDTGVLKNKIAEIYNDYLSTLKPENKGGSCAILTEPIKNKINWALDFIKYAGVALMIGLGALDFLKATLSDDDSANKKAFESFTKRLIAVILLFLLPLLIQFLFTTVDNPVIKIPGFNVDSPTCGIGESK